MLEDSDLPFMEKTCQEVSIAPEADPSRPGLIHARTASWIATQTSHKPWKEKYANKMASLEGGALSEVGAPCKVIGGEISGAREILAMIFPTLPESFPAELQEKYRDLDSEQETDRGKKTANKISKSVLGLGDPSRCKAAGLDVIQEALRETTERLIAGRGGEPYMEQLEKIKNRKQAAADAKLNYDPQYPVVRELSNETLRTIYTTKGLASFESLEKEEGTFRNEEDEEEEVKEEHVVTGPACSFESLHISSKFFLEKLTCILELLCSLNNLRHRHLKSRKPLSREVVFSLRQFPSLENSKETREGSSGTQLPEIQLQPGSSRDLLASSALPSVGLESSLSDVYSGSNLSSVADSRHLLSSSGTFRLRFGGSGLSSAKTDQQRVEVWEDLLAVETGETPGKSLPPKYRPPWQQSLTRDSLQLHLGGRKSKRAKGKKSKVVMLTTDTSLLVPNFREFLARTREKVHRKTLQELEKLESCRLQKFHLLFQSLNTLNEIPEKYFPRMRKLLGETKKEYTTEWFRRLVEEADSLQVRNNGDVSNLLRKLKQFVYKQPTDLPLYREKMCLLVLSLPADEICRPAWQSALTFVMVRVLEWKLEVLKYWLSTRYLYILQYIEDAS